MAAATPVLGSLKLYDWPLGKSYSRSTRVAELHDRSPGIHPTLLPSLFDATVVRVTFKGMLVVGTEIIITDGGLREYKQGWWAKPQPVLPNTSQN